MRIEFQLTETEFREAQLGRPPHVKHVIVALLPMVWILLICALPIVLWVINEEGPTRHSAGGHDLPRAVPETSAERAWHLFSVTSPVLIVLLTLLGMALLTAVRAVPLPWLLRTPNQAFSTTAVIAGIISGLLLIWSFNQPRTAYEGALIVAPLVMIILLLAMSIIQNQTVVLRRRWEAQRTLHLPTTMEVTEQGRLVFQHALATLSYQWGAIEGYKETPNLLLLYLSPLSLWIVPKRAFVNPMDLGHFKGLLTVHVSAGQLLPQQQVTGFPVMPGPMTPPVPALPPAQPPPIPRSQDRSASE